MLNGYDIVAKEIYDQYRNIGWSIRSLCQSHQAQLPKGKEKRVTKKTVSTHIAPRRPKVRRCSHYKSKVHKNDDKRVTNHFIISIHIINVIDVTVGITTIASIMVSQTQADKFRCSVVIQRKLRQWWWQLLVILSANIVTFSTNLN